MQWQRQASGFVVAQLAVLSAVAAWAGWHVAQDRRARLLPALRPAPRTIEPLCDEPLVVSNEQLQRVLLKLRPRWDETVPRSDVSAPALPAAAAAAVMPAERTAGAPAGAHAGPVEAVAYPAANEMPVEPAEGSPGAAPPTSAPGRTPPKLNHIDHALRFWTLSARFGDRRFVSGEDLRRLLTDQRGFAQVYTTRQAPLLMDQGRGVRVRVGEGPASSSHVDHTMACLAEVGTPLDFPLVTAQRAVTYRALVEQSLRDFSLNQLEFEWSVLTYALFSKDNHWVTREGQAISFDVLAERMMREDWARGVCFGNHRLYGLVALLRIHDQWRDEGRELLSPEMHASVIHHLAQATRMLIAHQNAAGLWNADWPSETAGDAASSREGDRLSDRILATGHALEWWALAPAELQPPRTVVARAAQWLVQTIDELDEREVIDYYTYLSHAGRSLALWRGYSAPSEALQPEALSSTARQPDAHR